MFVVHVRWRRLALLGAAGKLDREATHCFMPTLVRRHSVAQRQTVGPITN